MTNKGDDCYFFYYSTCSKGDGCPFRHCEAAMGSEIMCSLWQENRCFRTVCKFRHMEIKKKRKEIACYWENQPGGCQKPHCAFHHEKPRLIDGVYVPPDKGQSVRKEKEEEMPQEDNVPPTPVPISNPTNPQLRGVIKSDTQESVPSPTHPPVVINPVDDEDDEDDLVSEEGDENSSVSPKKLASSSKDDSLNFGIKTLEEIRLMKALKANLKRSGYPISNMTGTEKENIQSPTMPAALTTKRDVPAFENPGKRNITDRLGKVIHREDIPVEGERRLRGSLAKRLGGFVEPPDNPDMPPQIASVRPVHERLGMAPDLTAPKSPNPEPKSSGEIRIKTLEEIRQEKAAKSQQQHKIVRVVMEVPETTSSTTKKGIRPVNGPQVKTFSEVLHEKKKQQEEKEVPQKGSSSPERSDVNTVPVKEAAKAGEVRVKTLEEIRKEKAARTQATDTANENATNLSNEAQKKRFLRIGKNTAAPTSPQKKPQDSEKKMDHVAEPVEANGKTDSTSQAVKVKSFEEIMREKRLRKQQEMQANQSEQPGHKPPLSEEKPPTKIRPRITGPEATPRSTEPSNQTKVSIQQRLGLKSQSSSSGHVEIPQKRSAEPQANKSFSEPIPKKLKQSPSDELPGQVAEVNSNPGVNAQEPLIGKTEEVPKTSPSKAVEVKVRPKLNVKPSVVKPDAQVKLGQKRKAAGTHCSAVAAVKPLNAVAASESEPPSKRLELSAPVCSSDVRASTQRPTLAEDAIILSSKKTSSVNVPQSPVIKTPTQTRARRASVISGRTAAPAGTSSSTDDFEDLLDEFTDDKLEDEVELDPGVGEDDLLLELSEMIDI